jgi:hypothetical protein
MAPREVQVDMILSEDSAQDRRMKVETAKTWLMGDGTRLQAL